MIDAAIASLPPIGAEFSNEQRDAWFALMRNAFVLAYGGAGGGSMQASRTKKTLPARRAGAQRPSRAASPPKRQKVEPAFYIDRQNFVRRRGGDRILPNHVGGYIVDMRGINGALETIVWADESVGPPKGLALDITVADASEQ